MRTNIEYNALYAKILNKLNSEKIESDESVVSLKFVKDACNSSLYYNAILLDRMDKTIKKYNKVTFKSRLKNKNYPRLCDIKYYVKQNGDVYARYIFEDNNVMCVSLNNENFLYIKSSSFRNEADCDFLIKNYADIDMHIRLLREFAREFPNTEYTFDKLGNPYNQEISDGTFKSIITLNDINGSYVTLSNIKDLALAVESGKYGELYDYIEFYNEELSSKIAINVEELNPFIKNIVLNYLNKEKTSQDEIKLERKK